MSNERTGSFDNIVYPQTVRHLFDENGSREYSVMIVEDARDAEKWLRIPLPTNVTSHHDMTQHVLAEAKKSLENPKLRLA